jgi:hypothetical protein
MRKWHEFEHNNQYYYNEVDGLIIGQVHKFGTSTLIYTATVKPDNLDKVLGYYISVDFAKKAVQRFWEIDDGTLIGYNDER